MKNLLSVFSLMTAFCLIFGGCSAAQENSMSTVEPVFEITESSEQETQESTEPADENPEQETTKITFTSGETVITAELDGSETTKAFFEMLPLTLTMNNYDDREYYASIGALPENGEAIVDYENGDITYYTVGQSLAVFFGKEDVSSQSGLIRMGKITSDLADFASLGDAAEILIEIAESGAEDEMAEYDFSSFTNVEITGAELAAMTEEQLSVLYQQARYCQAMTEADIGTMSEIVSENSVVTHMSGKQQTREEYFADVESGSLRYFTIGIENPVVTVDGELASVNYTSVLNADAYGAQGTYRISGTHWVEKQDGEWISINNPEK